MLKPRIQKTSNAKNKPTQGSRLPLATLPPNFTEKAPSKKRPNIKHKILQNRNLNTKKTTYTAQSKTQYEKWVSDPTVHVEKEWYPQSKIFIGNREHPICTDYTTPIINWQLATSTNCRSFDRVTTADYVAGLSSLRAKQTSGKRAEIRDVFPCLPQA